MRDARHEIVALLPQLRGFARSLSAGDWQLADDLVQDTVVLALRAWDSFEPGTSLKSWLLKILHNRFHSLKRRKYHSAEIARDDLDTLSSVPPAQHARLEVAAFKQAFARLKPEHRAVLVLSSVQGQPYEAIAEICGCEVGTVKSRISRARAQLKEMLLGGEGVPGKAAAARAVKAPPAAARPRRAAARPSRVVVKLAPAPAPLPNPAPISFVPPPPPPPQPMLLAELEDAERRIVGLELRVTRYELLHARVARTPVDLAGTEYLLRQANAQLDAAHVHRDRLLRVRRGAAQGRAAA